MRAIKSPINPLPEVLTQIRTRYLFQLREAGPLLYVVGQTPNAFRRIGVVGGRCIRRRGLSGEVVSGNDWQDVRKDKCTKLDACDCS